jgi:hypothetical protein
MDGTIKGLIPPRRLPPEKLRRALERVRGAGVDGIVIFSAGGIASAGLWHAVGEFFTQ